MTNRFFALCFVMFTRLGADAQPPPGNIEPGRGSRGPGDAKVVLTQSSQKLSADVRGAWRKAGAAFASGKGKGTPSLTFQNRPKIPFAKLPAPDVPFTIKMRGNLVTAADFKDLAGMKNLRTLQLTGGIAIDTSVKVEFRGLSLLSIVPGFRGLRLETLNTTDAAFAEIASLKTLRDVHLSQIPITNATLTNLGKLPKLETLYIYGGHDEGSFSKAVSSKGLEGLARAPDLREITFHGIPVDDVGIAHLATLKDLTYLMLSDLDGMVTITDKGLKALAGMPRLSHLTLSFRKSRITDTGVQHLTGLKELTTLRLRYAEVTDDGLPHVAALKKLTHLDLGATAISTAGLKHLASMTSLEHLDLRGNGGLTAAGLKHLRELKNLKSLYLHATKMYGTPERDAHLAELRKALPMCKIETGASYTDP